MSLPPNRPFLRFKRLQNASQNLTSYVSGDLVDIPYPTTATGELVDPYKLWLHVKTHDFGPLHCFHGVPSRMFIPPSGVYAGQPIAACGYRPKSEHCKFWIMIADIHANKKNGLLVHEYPRREESGLAPSTPGSSQPSLSAPSFSQEEQSYNADSEHPASQLARTSDSLANFFQSNDLVRYDSSLLDFLVFNDTPTNTGATMAANPGSSASTSGSLPPAGRPLSLAERRRHRHRQSRNEVTTGARSKYGQLTVISPRSARPPLSGPSRIRIASPSGSAQGNRSFKALRDVIPPPPMGVAPDGAPVHYSEPASGGYWALLETARETGLPSRVFWSLFVACEGCNRVLLGSCLEDHVCDITWVSD